MARLYGLLGQSAWAKGLALHTTAPDKPSGPLMGDGVHQEQVQTNLIGHAIKFTERGRSSRGSGSWRPARRPCACPSRSRVWWGRAVPFQLAVLRGTLSRNNAKARWLFSHLEPSLWAALGAEIAQAVGLAIGKLRFDTALAVLEQAVFEQTGAGLPMLQCSGHAGEPGETQ